ncbi:MAG: YceI family protein [Bdellovibrionaceae bacterium]|nr:YceI family protein [Pseudobdellovibrionaceae bacterium]
MSQRQVLAAFAITLFTSGFAVAQSVEVDLKISPAGSFQAKTSKISGKAKKEGSKIVANGVKVDLASLSTGIKLRDEHMKDKYLEVAKHPQAELTVGACEGGSGKGKLKIRGIEKDVSGKCAVRGKNVFAEFEISLADFKIEGIRYMGAGVKDKATVKALVPIE